VFAGSARDYGSTDMNLFYYCSVIKFGRGQKSAILAVKEITRQCYYYFVVVHTCTLNDYMHTCTHMVIFPMLACSCLTVAYM